MNELIKAQIDNLIAFCEETGRSDIAALLCCAGVATESPKVCDMLIEAVAPIMIGVLIEHTGRNN